MTATLSRVLPLLAAASLACGNDDPAGPDGETAIPGLSLTAAVTPINTGGAFANGMILAVGVDITNTTSVAAQYTMPAGCAVRIRLYLSGSDRPKYDQTQFPCDASSTIPLNLAAGEKKTIPSGTSFPYNIESDSVAAGIYRATAVLRITGHAPIELEAGQYRLPHCANPAVPLSCTFVGPPATIDPNRKN